MEFLLKRLNFLPHLSILYSLKNKAMETFFKKHKRIDGLCEE